MVFIFGRQCSPPTHTPRHILTNLSNLLFCQAEKQTVLGEAICKTNASGEICAPVPAAAPGGAHPEQPSAPPAPLPPGPGLPRCGRGAEPRRGGTVLTEGAVLLLGAADLAVLLDLEKVFVVRVELPLAHVSLEVIVAPHVSPRTGRRGEGRGEGGGWWRRRVGGLRGQHVLAEVMAGDRHRRHQEEQQQAATRQVGKGWGTICQYPFAHCTETLGAGKCLIKRNILDG